MYLIVHIYAVLINESFFILFIIHADDINMKLHVKQITLFAFISYIPFVLRLLIKVNIVRDNN
jgi:hypothetical protein